MPIFIRANLQTWPLWPFEVAKFEKSGFLQISPQRCMLEQKDTSVGSHIFAVFWGVTEITFCKKMLCFGDIAKALFQSLNKVKKITS